MRRLKIARFATILLATLIVAATIPYHSVAAEALTGTTVHTSLAHTGWVAYSFDYPGDNSKVGIRLTYDIVDEWTAWTSDAVTFEVYRPGELPSSDREPDPLGRAHRLKCGVEYWEFNSETAGTYIVIAHNWEPLHRTVGIELTTFDVVHDSEGNIDFAASTPGPSLSFVSSSADQAALDLAAGPDWDTVSATVSSGGWVAYSFDYPGDKSDVGVLLNYDPVDAWTETIKDTIKLEIYRPGDLPSPNREPDPMGCACQIDRGVQYWEFNSETVGTYVIVVHNWDFLKRPVTVELTTFDVVRDRECNIDFVASGAGPVLTFVSEGP